MRVWVTRDEDSDGPLCSALRDAGLSPVLEAVLTRHVLDDAAEAIGRLGFDDWLVLTSVYAIESVAVEPARVPRVAVVSEPSRRAAAERGFRVELTSSGGGARSLFDELRSEFSSGTVCYPRSVLAKAPAPWPGVEIVSPILYETHSRDFDRSVIERVDVVSVTSPSAVDAICSAVEGMEDLRRILTGLRFAGIGPTTSASLRRHGLKPWVEASDRSFPALAQSIASKASETR